MKRMKLTAKKFYVLHNIKQLFNFVSISQSVNIISDLTMLCANIYRDFKTRFDSVTSQMSVNIK